MQIIQIILQKIIGIRRFVSARQNYEIRREINQSTTMKKKEDGNISIGNSKEMFLKEAKICGTNENQYNSDMKGISYNGGLCHAAG
jgi:hypothetical protein